MSNEEIKTRIEELRNECHDWQRIYRQLKSELDMADKEIMARQKAIWSLERSLISVTKVKAYSPTTRMVKKPVDQAFAELDLDKMSVQDLSTLLYRLKQAQQGRDEED